MQSLLKFIQKYSNFLVFIALEVVAFLLLTSYNEYPKSSFLSTANSIAVWNYKVANDIGSYFHLRKTNEYLEAENMALRNQIIALQNQLEDSVESSEYQYSHLDYHCQPARVVHLTTNRQQNYLTINKGRRDSVYQGMGVRNHEGVVGIVTTVGERFAIVIPVINTNCHISAKFVKNGYYAALEWDGPDYRYAKLTDVASHLPVERGDSIVTSGLSAVFPADIPLAVVEDVELKKGDPYYNIKVRLDVDFRKLEYVQLINKHSYNEQVALEEDVVR
jgi:rod shape-determining protein MreC